MSEVPPPDPNYNFIALTHSSEGLDDLPIEGAVAETAVGTNRIKLPITVKCEVGLPGFQ